MGSCARSGHPAADSSPVPPGGLLSAFGAEMLRMLALFVLAFLPSFARAQECIPYANIVNFGAMTNGYHTVVTTGLTGPLSTVTAPLSLFHPDAGRQCLWVGSGPGPASQGGAVHAVAPVLNTGQRAYSTPPGSAAFGPASTIETEWTTNDGSRQRVITPCFSFNTPVACAQAHLEMVRAMQQLFPPRV